jgi:hypothetical protein
MTFTPMTWALFVVSFLAGYYAVSHFTTTGRAY